MLFRRLSQSNPGATLLAVEGYVVSVVAHVVILGTFFMPRSGKAPSEVVPESFQWVKFLLPRDRTLTTPGVREHLTFFPVAAPGGAGTLLDDAREPERMKLELPKGTEDDALADTAAAPPPSQEVQADEVMTVLQVDTAVARFEDSAAPPYPPAMLEKKIEGSVAVQYVVDTTGRADTTSFVVLSMTHLDFARSVKATLPQMRFRPAIMNSQKVRQLVQQQFSFRIDTTLLAQQKKRP